MSSTGELLRSIYSYGATSGHVARILNVSEAAVSLWGSGKRQPNDLHICQLRLLRDSLCAWDEAS